MLKRIPTKRPRFLGRENQTPKTSAFCRKKKKMRKGQASLSNRKEHYQKVKENGHQKRAHTRAEKRIQKINARVVQRRFFQRRRSQNLPLQCRYAVPCERETLLSRIRKDVKESGGCHREKTQHGRTAFGRSRWRATQKKRLQRRCDGKISHWIEDDTANCTVYLDAPPPIE